MDEFICCSELPVHPLSSHEITPDLDTLLVGYQKAFISLHYNHMDTNVVDMTSKSPFTLSLMDLYSPEAGVVSTAINIHSEIQKDLGFSRNSSSIHKIEDSNNINQTFIPTAPLVTSSNMKAIEDISKNIW